MAQPYDRNYKLFGQSDLRGLLYLFGRIPLDADVVIEPVPKELILPGLLIADDAFLIRQGDRKGILHLEAELRWHKGIPRDMGRYAQTLDLRLELPVRSILVLLTKQSAPEPVPDTYAFERGAMEFRFRYEALKLWEMDGAEVVDMGRPRLMPWALLMNTPKAKARKAGEMVEATMDRELGAQFVTFGTLGKRYDRVELLEMLGRLQPMLLRDEILEQSGFVQHFQKKAFERGVEEGREEGREEGHEAGRADGQAEEARRMLKLVLAKRFPGLETPGSIDRLNDAAAIERLVERIVILEDRAAATRLLEDAAQ